MDIRVAMHLHVHWLADHVFFDVIPTKVGIQWLSRMNNQLQLIYSAGTTLAVVKTFPFRLSATLFLLLSQKKQRKEKTTPLPLHPSDLAPHLDGGCGTRAFSTQTVLAAYHLPLKPKTRQRGNKNLRYAFEPSSKDFSCSRLQI
jgi:hypothetical protein